jgi:hypothetical protein
MGAPDSIIEIQSFDADEDVEVTLQVSQLLLLMPIFKWDGTHWIDATGDFDLCMATDGKTYTFISRRTGTVKYGYRYVPLAYLMRKYSRDNL